MSNSSLFRSNMFNIHSIKTYLANKSLAAHFVAIISAVILMVAPPPRSYAFAIRAPEFGFGAASVLVFAHGFILVSSVATVVGEIA